MLPQHHNNNNSYQHQQLNNMNMVMGNQQQQPQYNGSNYNTQQQYSDQASFIQAHQHDIYQQQQQQYYNQQQQLFNGGNSSYPNNNQMFTGQQASRQTSSPEYVQYSVNGNTFSLPKRYTMDGVKGAGGFGCVVSALDNKNNERVAIKKVSSLYERDRNYQKRILREIKILKHFRQFSAHNVVLLKDLFFDPYQPGSIYIVTNLMDFDLEKLLSSNQTFSEQSIQYFLHEILKAVNIMHSSNIIHRDLKPSNILLNRDLDLQICDFGLSRAIGQDYPEDSKYVVTRWYRSPEVVSTDLHVFSK